MVSFEPLERQPVHGAVMGMLVNISSAFGSFLFVMIVATGAFFYHLRQVITGIEPKNKPKDNSGSEYYTPQEPYPDMKNLKVTKDLRYYANQLGLELEEYLIVTKDGFVLVLHRLIDPSETAAQRQQKTPILLQHGLLSCSGCWLAPGANSLPYYFVKQGLDVWMGNNRLHFEPKHAYLEGHLGHNESYWNWDVRLLAAYDLPCIIDNVLSHKPHHEKLFLVGHSQGCTQTILMLRNPELEEWHKKVVHFTMLAPAIFPGPLFHERMFIKFIHNRLPPVYRAIFGSGIFIGFLGWARRVLGPYRIYRAMLYQMFKYLFGWSVRNSYKDKKIQHIQFLMNVSYVSARLMSWWLSHAVEESFSNNLPLKEDFKTGQNYAITPTNLIEQNETEKQNNPDVEANPNTTEEEKNMSSNQEGEKPQPPAAEARSAHLNDKTFFPYKTEWFPFKSAENAVPMMGFTCGEDLLVDGLRLTSHMQHYESRLYNEGHNLEMEHVPHYNHIDVCWAQDVIGRIGYRICGKVEKYEELTKANA